MPQLDPIIFLPQFRVDKASGGAEVELYTHYEGKVQCPHCQSRHYKIKQTFVRTVRHTSIGQRACWLKITSHRFKCKQCRRSFNQRFPGILKHQRATEVFKQEVVEKHHEGIPQSVLEKMLSIGHATIERWYHYIQERLVAEIKNNPAPVEMGIDEHHFTKKQGFATSLCSLGSHRIHDVILGKSEEAIGPYLKELKGKRKTVLVSMDLSETYRSIVKKYFPNAKIVADRFHVIRLINRYFAKAYKQIEPGLLKQKGMRWLLKYHEWNLQKDEAKYGEMKKYLKEHQALEALYDFKQKLCALLILKHRTAKQCRQLIPKLIAMTEELKNIPIKILRRLGRTLEKWQKEIARMWRFTKNNGILEGLHNKMELISRRAYGFKSFPNYRLRVRALCG